MKPAMKAALAALGCASLTAATAADIGWALGPGFVGPGGYSGILTNGSLVEAVGAAEIVYDPVTVDPSGLDISFQRRPVSGLDGFYGVAPPDSGDAAWNTVLYSVRWNSADITIGSFLTGLTVGSTYQLQLFATDLRGCCSARQQRYGDGNGNFSDFVSQDGSASMVGTFVADAETQALRFEGGPSRVLNAWVLREIAAPVPEPGTWALWGLGLLGVASAARRRR